jgi:predicted RNA-binding Zn-ribbon protein involved in translation (DUF1610 family)
MDLKAAGQAMSNALSEGTVVEITCPCCGDGHSTTIMWLRDHSSLTCSGCGFEIVLINERLLASIAEFSHATRGLKRS